MMQIKTVALTVLKFLYGVMQHLSELITEAHNNAFQARGQFLKTANSLASTSNFQQNNSRAQAGVGSLFKALS